MERGVGLILGSEPLSVPRESRCVSRNLHCWLSFISLSQASYHVRILLHSGREIKAQRGEVATKVTQHGRDFHPSPIRYSEGQEATRNRWDNEVTDTSFPS